MKNIGNRTLFPTWTRPGSRRIAQWIAIISFSQLAACGHQPPQINGESLTPVSADTDECRDRLALAPVGEGAELDPLNIRLFNWNMQKKDAGNWSPSVKSAVHDADLVLIQEASLREDTIAHHDSSKHWAFVPGYRRHGEVTGVMTLSNIPPLTQCGFRNAEPFLRTPKATGVTQYRLRGTDETLLVVNVHAVNFSLGLGAFEKQFDQIGRLLDAHNGPAILSGDLNTWRTGRERIVEDLAIAQGMTAVSFADDRRVTKFGHALDHIYIRGLHALDASTEDVDTSDHNPMTAVLTM